MPIDELICPHCGVKLKKWASPSNSTWGTEFQYVCFNDECPYYVRGWEWMLSQFNVKSSYRYRYNPITKDNGPLPTWSQDAHKSNIVEDDDKE